MPVNFDLCSNGSRVRSPDSGVLLVSARDGMFGSKVGQIGSKLENSGFFSDLRLQSYILAL